MSARPAEDQARQEQEDRAQQVAAQCAEGNTAHEAEVMSHHQGAPSVAVQARTHAAGIPAVDNGPDPGSVI